MTNSGGQLKRWVNPLHLCDEILAGPDGIEVMPVADYQRDIVRLATELAETRAQLHDAGRAAGDAAQLLTPGMKAGVGAAKKILEQIVQDVQIANEPGADEGDAVWP